MFTALRILLIEDNPGDADLIEVMLKRADIRFELKCVERLYTGIEQIQANSFDIILLDLGLPDGHGLDTLRKLNEVRPEAPVIVLTGLADETVGTQAVKEGAQDYLIKGQIDKNLLARAINYAIERKKTQETLKESEEQYRTLFDNSIDAVLLGTPDGEILAANPEACRMFGYSEKEICERGRLGIVDTTYPLFKVLLGERSRTG